MRLPGLRKRRLGLLPHTRITGGGVLPWDGVTKFTAAKGFHTGVYSFDQWDLGLPDNGWPTYWTEDRWSAVLDNTTADHLRIGIDPTSLLTNYGTATFSTLFGRMKFAIDQTLARGLKVILDMHVAFVGTYSDENLMAGHAAQNATWDRMKAVWREVALLCNRYGTDEVAFEVYNECHEYESTRYIDMLVELVAYLRTQVGYRTTFLLAPPGFADPGAFTFPAFVASDYGDNVGFVYHHYEPHWATHQGVSGIDGEQYFSDLPFPAPNPDPGNAARDAAIAATTARINADSSLTGPQKTAMIATTTAALNEYFTEYVLNDNWTGTTTVKQIYRWSAIFGSFDPTDNGTQVRKWQKDNGVADSAMFVTEIGVNRYVGTAGGALDADAAAYYALSLRYLTKNGWAFTVYNDGAQQFTVRQRATSSPVTYGDAFDRDLMAALDMFKPSDAWLPSDEPNGTFSKWIDGADRSSFTASGGFVSQITDKSGAGNHWIQATSNLQPIDETDGARTDATRFFNSTLPANNDNEAIFVVVTPSTVSGDRTIFGPAASGGKRQFRTSGTDIRLLRSGVGQDASASGLGLVAGSRQLLELQMTFGGQTTIGRNGVLNTSAGNHTTSFGAAANSRIGTKDDGGEDGLMTFHGALVLPTKPKPWLAAQIRHFLKNRHGVA